MPTTPTLPRVQKKEHPEIPSEDILKVTGNYLKSATLDFVNKAESYERELRLEATKMEERIRFRESSMNRAWARLTEEEERERRIIELLELGREIKKKEEFKKKEEEEVNKEEKERSEFDRAYTKVLEEEERSRRIAEEGYLDEIAEEQRKDNQAYAIIAEEEEKERRIAEDEYVAEMEEEIRKTNQAYAIISEEMERQRRIGELQYEEETLKNYEETNRAYSRIKEEEEKARRISSPPTKEELFLLKNLAIAAVEAKRSGTWMNNMMSKLKKEKKLKESSKTFGLLKKDSHLIFEVVPKKEKKNPSLFDVHNMEENERKWRIQNPPTLEQLEERRKLALDASHPFKKVNLIKILEEAEQQRRILNPPAQMFIENLKKRAQEAANAAISKSWVREPITSKNLKKSTDHKVWKPKKKENLKDTRIPIKVDNSNVPILIETKKEEFSVPIKVIKRKKIPILGPEDSSEDTQNTILKQEKNVDQKTFGETIPVPKLVEMGTKEPTVIVESKPTKSLVDERRELVDKMSKELFEKISSEVFGRESRK